MKGNTFSKSLKFFTKKRRSGAGEKACEGFITKVDSPNRK